MIRRTMILTTAAAACLLSGAASASYSEAFNGTNEGGWTWGFGDTFPAFGGNPGSYLQTAGLDTFAPMPRTTTAVNEFTGDYNALGVTSVGVDLKTDFAGSTGGRPCTLMLIHDNGTPGTPLDDTAAYFMGPNIPAAGAGWISYDYDVPSQEATLPTGWLLLNLGDSGAPPNHTWAQVIQDVNRVQFFYGDPTYFFIFQQWGLGMDNVRIETDAPVPGDVNGDGVVNFADILAIIGQWGFCPGCAGDLDGDNNVGFSDILIVIGNWS
ncbi:MAG: hypothetical protein GY715_22325 [Planctomycetes bacterium]|nr:hypothetical protein [Planctomycetota bacterium]